MRIIVNNAIDILTYLSSRLRASGKTTLEDRECEEDSQDESLMMSCDSEDNICMNNTNVID